MVSSFPVVVRGPAVLSRRDGIVIARLIIYFLLCFFFTTLSAESAFLLAGDASLLSSFLTGVFGGEASSSDRTGDSGSSNKAGLGDAT